jgi:tRNA (Thr-GGU) A37 N-methylase
MDELADGPKAHAQLIPIGVVTSALTRLEDCPKEGVEGAPEAWLEIQLAFCAGAERNSPRRRTRGVDVAGPGPARHLDGASARRSCTPADGCVRYPRPHRPNPIGLHRVSVLQVQGNRIEVRPLEALDGTPVIDIKPVLRKSAVQS